MHGLWSALNHVRLFLVALLAMGFFAYSPMAVHAATTDNVTGWAWSGSIGWISLNCTNLDTCATSNYGVTLDDKPGDSGTAIMSGYAWSETVGWICFGSTCTGNTPEGTASYAEFRDVNEGKTNQMWGWAKVVSLNSEGWISLNCDKDTGVDACTDSNYYVMLDPLTGIFGTTNPLDHWAWGSNTDNVGVGWVDMSGMQTDWNLTWIGQVERPQGYFEPQNSPLPGTRTSVFKLKFPSLQANAGNYLECAIKLPDGSERRLGKVFASAIRTQLPPPAGPTSLTYTIEETAAVTQGLTTTSCVNDLSCGSAGKCDISIGKCRYSDLWYVSCFIAGIPKTTNCHFKTGPLDVMNDDSSCASGDICDEVLGKCRAVIRSTDLPKPIYTHTNQWTGLGAMDDWYLALKCNAGFPGNYFKNSASCDYAGDASFALTKWRAVGVEENCEDNIDNDSNGQTDCNDRYCKGVSYRCQTLKRTSCVVGEAGDGMPDCSDPSYVNGALCCSAQPRTENPALSHVVDGLECKYHDVKDGYYDCDCTTASGNFGTNPDCYAPGKQPSNLCCSATNEVLKQ